MQPESVGMQPLFLLALGAVLVLLGAALLAIRRLKAKTRAIQSDLAEAHREHEATRTSSLQAHIRFQKLLRQWRGNRERGGGSKDQGPK